MKTKYGVWRVVLPVVVLAAIVLISYRQPPLSYLGGTQAQKAESKRDENRLTLVAPAGLFKGVSFEEVDKSLGKTVTISEFSNQQIIEKLSQSFSTDLVAFQSDYASRIYSRGLVQRVDTEQVKNVSTKFLDLPYARWAGFKTGSGPAYAVPYVARLIGICARSELVQTANTWGMFWDARFRGRIGALSREEMVFLAAVLRNVNLSSFGENTEKTLEAVAPSCKQLIANDVRFYDNVSSMLKDLESNRLDAVMISERDADEFTNRRTGFSFVEPKQGMVAFVYCLCVPVRVANAEQSYALASSLLAPSFAASLFRAGVGLPLVGGIEDQLSQGEHSEYERQLKSFNTAIVFPSLNMDAQQALDDFVESLRASKQ